MAANEKRREFLRESLAMAGVVPVALVDTLVRSGSVPVASSRESANTQRASIKLGILGCGRRGLQLAKSALSSSLVPVEVVGLADLFPDRIQQLYRSLNGQYQGRVKWDGCPRWAGASAIDHLAESEVEVVVVTSPTGLRTQHVRRMIEAGKHVYAEAPVATEPNAAREFASLNDRAKQMGVGLTMGLPHRYRGDDRTILAELQNGIIGRPVLGRLEFCIAEEQPPVRTKRVSVEEYRSRHWRWDRGLGGSRVVEALVSHLDKIAWAMGMLAGSEQNYEGRPPWVRSTNVESHAEDNMHRINFQYSCGARLECCLRFSPHPTQRVSQKIQCTGGWCDVARNEIFDSKNQCICSAPSQRSDNADGLMHLLSLLWRHRLHPDQVLMPCHALWGSEATIAVLELEKGLGITPACQRILAG